MTAQSQDPQEEAREDDLRPQHQAEDRWDDGAKEQGKPTRTLSAWTPLLQKYFGVVTDAAR